MVSIFSILFVTPQLRTELSLLKFTPTNICCTLPSLLSLKSLQVCYPFFPFFILLLSFYFLFSFSYLISFLLPFTYVSASLYSFLTLLLLPFFFYYFLFLPLFSSSCFFSQSSPATPSYTKLLPYSPIPPLPISLLQHFTLLYPPT